MKIGIFTDSHYSSQEITCGKRHNSRSLDKIKKAYSFFQEEKCNQVICLGDLIDKEDSHGKEVENLKKIAEVIKNSGIPTICIMGNHDAFAFTTEEFYDILEDCHPINRGSTEKKLIFLDACYFENGKHYMPGDSDWTDTCLTESTLAWLETELNNSDTDTYIFMHQNIDPCISQDHRLANADKIIRIIEKSTVVKKVFQGHYHPGKKTVQNGVEYITLPAMCENENAYYII